VQAKFGFGHGLMNFFTGVVPFKLKKDPNFQFPLFILLKEYMSKVEIAYEGTCITPESTSRVRIWSDPMIFFTGIFLNLETLNMGI
jgi:hypothetical protein